MVVVHSDMFLLVFVLPLILAYLAMVFAVLRHLEAKHPEIWYSLGRPSVLNFSPKNGWIAGNYILFQRKYRSLGGSRLERLVDITRVLFWLSLLGLLARMFGMAP